MSRQQRALARRAVRSFLVIAGLASALPVLAQQSATFHLVSATSASVTVTNGSAFSADLEADAASMDTGSGVGGNQGRLSAFTAKLSFDPAILTAQAPVFVNDTWPRNTADGGTGFRSVDVDNGAGRVTVAAIADVTTGDGDQFVPAADDVIYFQVSFATAVGLSNVCHTTSVGFDTTNVDDNLLADQNAASVENGSGLTLNSLTVTVEPSAGFVRGNANDSEIDGDAPQASVTIADVLFVLNDLFGAGPTPGCLEAADANNDDRYNIVDAVTIAQYLFGNTNVMLPAPFPQVQDDDPGDSIDCATPQSFVSPVCS